MTETLTSPATIQPGQHPQDRTTPEEYLKQIAAMLDEKLAPLTPKRNRKDEGSGDPIIGSIVRKYRMAQGWSLDDLAKATGLNRAFLGRIEQGKRGMSLHTYLLITHHLGVHINGWTINGEIQTYVIDPLYYTSTFFPDR